MLRSSFFMGRIVSAIIPHQHVVIVFSVIALLSVLICLAVVPSAGAVSLVDGINSAQGDGIPTELFGSGGIFTTITNILLFIIGALSVIMLIIGGLRYVLSGGNSTAVSAAKNTILYAIVGLIVAFMAYATINFVLDSLMSGTAGGGGIDV